MGDINVSASNFFLVGDPGIYTFNVHTVAFEPLDLGHVTFDASVVVSDGEISTSTVPGVGPVYSVFDVNLFQLNWSQANGGTAFVAGETGFLYAQYAGASGIIGNGGIAAATVALGKRPYDVSASTSIVVRQVAARPGNTITVSAANEIYIETDTSEYKTPIIVVAASGIVMSSTASCLATGNKPVSASSGVVVSYSPEGLSIGDRAVTASSGIIVSQAFTWTSPGPRSVVASSGIVAGSRVSCDGFIAVSASSGIQFYAINAQYAASLTYVASPQRIVFASSSFKIEPAAVCGFTGSHLLSASNGIIVSQGITRSIGDVWILSASSGIHLSEVGSETADRVLVAASGIVLRGVSSACRDIHVSAATSFGVKQAEETNEFFVHSAANGIVIGGVATHALSGTLAQTTLVFTTLARAVVVLPWRRTSLSLPPGGGIPHS